MQQQVDMKSDKHAATGRYKTWQHIASRCKTGQTCDRWIKQGDRSEVVYKARRQPTLAGVGWAACGLPLCRKHCWRAHRRRAAKPFSWLSSSLVTPVTRPEVVRIGRSPFGTSLKLLNGATLVVHIAADYCTSYYWDSNMLSMLNERPSARKSCCCSPADSCSDMHCRQLC